MEASNLIPKSPAVTTSLAFEGIEVSSEEGGGFGSSLWEELG
jgi:hypothetical protein